MALLTTVHIGACLIIAGTVLLVFTHTIHGAFKAADDGEGERAEGLGFVHSQINITGAERDHG